MLFMGMKFNISGKIILIAVTGVIASSLTILGITTILMGRLLNYTIHKEMAAMQSLIARMQQQDEARLLQEIQLLTSIPDLVDAVQRLDADGIRANAQMSWLRREIDLITFTDSNGITIFRSHSDLTGDDISSRPAIMMALNDGYVSSGIFFDETAVVPYSIRCYSPIFKEGVLVGALSLGSDIGAEKYVDNLYILTGIHFSLYKDDVTLMTSLMDRSGRRNTGSKLENNYITDTVLGKGESVIVQRDIFGVPYMAMYWPIKNSNRETIGMWANAMPMDRQVIETNRVLLIIILCSLGIMGIFILAAGILGNRISRPIRKITDFAVNVAKGNLDDEIKIKSNDELGQLAGALLAMVATLKERINDAVAANKAKSTFFSTVSHEIRTPMNAIIGITETQLRREDLPANVREVFERIYTSGDMLMRIINDILDLSKIESGKLELLEKNYDFANLISDTARLNIQRINQIPIEPMPFGSILIVDDIEMNIFVAKGLMQPYALKKIDSVNSGPDAIKRIKDGNVYDVVFMDHMMPGMDGMEAVKLIREAGYKEPIVALTANVVEEQVGFFLQNGFDDIISKPIVMRQLNVIMNTYVRDKQPLAVIEEARKQALEKKQKTEKPADCVLPQDTSKETVLSILSELSAMEIPGLDIAKGVKRFGGKEKTYNEKTYIDVLRSYAADVSSLLDEIETFNADNLADYVIKVHGIKGTSYDIFAEQVANEALELEKAGKAGDLEFIAVNHQPFMEKARALVSGIETMLSNIDLESRKPLLDKPDIRLLSKLIKACNDYDMGGADKTMAELDSYKYEYESDNDLISWLRNSVDKMQFEEIVEKLNSYQ